MLSIGKNQGARIRIEEGLKTILLLRLCKKWYKKKLQKSVYILLSLIDVFKIILSRAVYTDADIFFLDDPLSAVDPKVGTEIFEKYFLQ